MESVCGGNSTVGSNPTLSVSGSPLDPSAPSMGRRFVSSLLRSHGWVERLPRMAGCGRAGYRSHQAFGGLCNWSLKTPPGPEGSNGIGQTNVTQYPPGPVPFQFAQVRHEGDKRSDPLATTTDVQACSSRCHRASDPLSPSRRTWLRMRVDR